MVAESLLDQISYLMRDLSWIGTDWKISLKQQSRRPESDLLGIKNMGMTCYLNSVLQ